MKPRAPRALLIAAACLSVVVCGAGSASLAVAAPPAPAADENAPAATMVGFRKTGDNTALVYVQLTRSTEVRSSQKGRTLTFTMKGISVPKRTNRYPLVASHFDSVVDSVRLVPSKNDTDLVIALRRDAKATVQVLRAGEGAVVEVHLVGEAQAPAKPAPSASP